MSRFLIFVGFLGCIFDALLDELAYRLPRMAIVLDRIIAILGWPFRKISAGLRFLVSAPVRRWPKSMGKWLKNIGLGNIILGTLTLIVFAFAVWQGYSRISTANISMPNIAIDPNMVTPIFVGVAILLAVANFWRAVKIKRGLGQWIWQEQRKLFFASLIVLGGLVVCLLWPLVTAAGFWVSAVIGLDCLVVGGLIVLYLIKSRARNPKEKAGKHWNDPLEQKFGRYRCTIWERPFYPRQRKNAAKGEKKTLLLKAIGSWTAAFVTYGLSVSGKTGKVWAIGGAIAVPVIIYSAIAFHFWALLLALPLAVTWWIAWAISWPDVYVVADKTDRLLIILPKDGVLGLQWEAQLAAVGFNKLRWGDKGAFGIFGSYADPGVSLGTEETRFLFVGPELLAHMIEITGKKPVI